MHTHRHAHTHTHTHTQGWWDGWVGGGYFQALSRIEWILDIWSSFLNMFPISYMCRFGCKIQIICKLKPEHSQQKWKKQLLVWGFIQPAFIFPISQTFDITTCLFMNNETWSYVGYKWYYIHVWFYIFLSMYVCRLVWGWCFSSLLFLLLLFHSMFALKCTLYMVSITIFSPTSRC